MSHNFESAALMAFGTFTAYAALMRVRLRTPLEALAYSEALPAITQARPHWQAAITAMRNADDTEALLDNARDSFGRALSLDGLLVDWSEKGDWL